MAIDFRKIKELFVESSENQSAKPEPAKDAPTDQTDSVTVSSSPVSAAVDEKILNSLIKVIQDHNLPGEDYLEFLDALKAMENIPLDEKMKIQTVLATLSTKGLSAPKIKESADYYKKVLQEEQKQFYAELSKQIETQLKSKEKGITDIQAENNSKTAEITRLTNEINENQKKISELQTQIKDSEFKIKTAEGNFNKTLDYLITQIDSNIQKINN